MKIKAVILDVDGVLHDSFDYHRRRIGEFVGKDLSEDEFRDMHNGNFFESVPPEIKNTDWHAYAKHIHHEQSVFEISDRNRKNLLKLSDLYDLFLVSSGSGVNITASLEFNAVDHLFEEVLGLESHKSKVDKFRFILDTHELAADDCFFVTDTLGDILEANMIGIRTVAVEDFGYHGRLILTRGNPYQIISNLDEIHDVLESL